MHRSTRRPTKLHLQALSLVLGAGINVGCGQVAGYPEATITSPIGRDGVCVACSKTIDSVKEVNLITIEGNQFIVCDKVCASRAAVVTEHAHAH